MTLEVISEHACFGGTMGYYRHPAETTQCPMQFSVYRPPAAASGPVPVVTWLSGLTCNEETFMIKAGAQRVAAELGLMLVSPDTSPRGHGVPDADDAAYDLGLGAGFYLNAVAPPWADHYRMYDYVTNELPRIVGERFDADLARQGIFGHSMGGHGALTIGLRNPSTYRSISAFAPIANPSDCPWGVKAFSNYLGGDRATWQEYDATALVNSVAATPANPLLVDQGMADQFLVEQLHPDKFAAACAERGVELRLRRHDGYDHGYFFIQSFIEDHLHHHAQYLGS